VGALQTGYVPGLAAFAGSSPVTADWRFFLNDHLGSPRQVLGQNKSAKARYDFSPYGELMRSAGLPLTVGYTGHRWDPAIGQYFAPFRYYNPQTARWNMRDPLGDVEGPNVYAYVAGNPARYIDRKGLCGWCLIAVGVGIAVAGIGYHALSNFFDKVMDESNMNKVRARGAQHGLDDEAPVKAAHDAYVSTGQSLGKDSKGLGGMPLGVPSPDVVTTPIEETADCIVDYLVDKVTDIGGESDESIAIE
jgi:RHS repeat-associated protein